VVEVPGPAHAVGISRPDATAVRTVAWSASDARGGSARADFARAAMRLGGKVALASGGGTGIGGAERRASAPRELNQPDTKSPQPPRMPRMPHTALSLAGGRGCSAGRSGRVRAGAGSCA